MPLYYHYYLLLFVCLWIKYIFFFSYQLEGVMAAVDATKHQRLNKEWEIQGFPTLKYFK